MKTIGLIGRMSWESARGMMGMLIGPESIALPPYDTAVLHDGALIEFALCGCSP